MFNHHKVIIEYLNCFRSETYNENEETSQYIKMTGQIFDNIENLYQSIKINWLCYF